MEEEKEYKLSISPDILKLLGPNLYTNIYYVLAELIANAYDASAKNVYIISNEDSIIVEDDGKGMSYKNNEIRHYLDVAKETRSTEEEALTTDDPPRRKMGRKGVGKLASLSVSENVYIMTKSNNEKSGFILSRSVPSNQLLTPIEDSEIKFEKINDIDHGTAVVMNKPQYHLHKTIPAIKRNLLKIFPMVNTDFRIHIILNGEDYCIEAFEKEMIQDLATFEIYGDEFIDLKKYYQNSFPEKEGSDVLCVEKSSIIEPIYLKNNYGIKKKYNFELKGWIGTYKSTSGRKLGDKTDFPDNFISLFANKKLGEFNILPIIGKNRLNEVYVVGQFHIDLFEETELPDMALSNRQGYKSDDLRYQMMLGKADVILKDALSLRTIYSDFNRNNRNEKLLERQKQKDEELNKAVKNYKESFKKSLSKNIKKHNSSISDEIINSVTDETSNETIGLLGIKKDADKKRKKILLSQTLGDKPLSDLIYELLLYNNIPQEDILYSNSDNIASRLPLRTDIYDYLRNLFVDTYSEEKLYIIYVTSENMGGSWGCHMEAGAGWIIKNEYCIFNINSYAPLEPLKNGSQWHSSVISETNEVSMDKGNISICIDYVTHICELLGYTAKSSSENEHFLTRRVNII